MKPASFRDYIYTITVFLIGSFSGICLAVAFYDSWGLFVLLIPVGQLAFLFLSYYARPITKWIMVALAVVVGSLWGLLVIVRSLFTKKP